MGEGSVYLVELLCPKWQTLRTIKDAKRPEDVPWPRIEAIKGGDAVVNDKMHVFLAADRLRDIDVFEMRDWTQEFVKNKFRMFNRFRYESLSLKTEKKYLGMTARFDDIDDALYFKLFWY